MSGDPIYTEMIIEYSRNPSNFGKIENPQIHRHDSNPLCGDSIDLYVNTDGTKITEVKFDGKGCAICMACTSVLTEMIQNKNLDEVKNFQKDELLAELGLEHLIKTSPVRIKCALLSLKALKYGIYSYFVEKMNEAGMLIDLSHANMQTMTDAVDASKVPVIVSHTACEAVYKNARNTTDENMRLVAKKGGVIGICQIRPFVTNIRKGAFEHYLNHIEHAIKVAGIDHVSIGSDRDHRVIEMSDEYIAELKREEGNNFDASHWPLFMDELNGPRRMEVIWDGLKKRGLSERKLEKVMGQNNYRIYKEVVG